MTDEGDDRNKGGRNKEDDRNKGGDRNKTLTSGTDQHLEEEKRDVEQDASSQGARQGKVYEGGEVGRSAMKKDEGLGRNGDVYKGGGVGLSVKMEDKGAGRNDDVDKDE